MTRDLFLMAASLFTWGIGEGMFFYFQPIYLQNLGASPVGIGSILGATGLIMAFTQLPAGYLADRFGRRPLIWLSWVTGCVATLIMATASTLNIFIIGILMYAFTGFVMPPMNSYITHARGKWTVAGALTFGSAAYNLGAVAGPIIGGNLAEAFGLKTIYSVSAIIFVISTVIVFFISRQPVEVHPDLQPRTYLFKNTRFMGLLGIICFAIFATYLPQPLAPNFLQNVRGLSLSTIGILGSIGCLGNSVLVFALGRLKTRHGYLIGQFAVLAFTAILWLGTGLPWFMVGYFLLGGFKAVRALSLALVRPLIHSSHMGVAYGMIDTATSFAIILSPTLAGFLYQYNPLTIFSISAILICVSILISIVVIPRGNSEPETLQIFPERNLE